LCPGPLGTRDPTRDSSFSNYHSYYRRVNPWGPWRGDGSAASSRVLRLGAATVMNHRDGRAPGPRPSAAPPSPRRGALDPLAGGPEENALEGEEVRAAVLELREEAGAVRVEEAGVELVAEPAPVGGEDGALCPLHHVVARCQVV